VAEPGDDAGASDACGPAGSGPGGPGERDDAGAARRRGDASPGAPSLRTLPLFPLGTVLYPGGPLTLRIFEPRYVDMVGRCMKELTGFGVVLLVQGREAGANTIATAAIGTEAKIVDFYQLDDGLLGLTCVGQRRFRLVRAWRQEDGLNVGEVEDLPEDPTEPVPDEWAHLPAMLKSLFPRLGDPYSFIEPRWQDAGWVANRFAELAPLDAETKQALLQIDDPLARLREIAPMIRDADDEDDDDLDPDDDDDEDDGPPRDSRN
jgi:Lon protease-like protein